MSLLHGTAPMSFRADATMLLRCPLLLTPLMPYDSDAFAADLPPYAAAIYIYGCHFDAAASC